MRKPDEIALYAELRRLHGGPYRAGGPKIPFADAVGEGLGIHPKRVHSILEKWTIAGWWNYGVTLRSGWFEPKAPEVLTP